jgi:hypothetical protein
MRTARTRYNVQSRGNEVGVRSRQARSIRQRYSKGYGAGFLVTDILKDETKYK